MVLRTRDYPHRTGRDWRFSINNNTGATEMLLLPYFLFALIRAGSAARDKASSVLDIQKEDKDHFKIEDRHLDNVVYKHFTPLRNDFVLSVTEGSVKIWQSVGYGRCVYALLAFSEQEPAALYLKIDYGYTIKSRFYRKSVLSWTPIEVDDYCTFIAELKKKREYNTSYTLDVFDPNTKCCGVDYATKEDPFTYFYSALGYFATAVHYRGTKLWNAEAAGDRCVSVWAYVHSGSYYMIRMLVTKANGESQILTFFVVQGKWVHVHTLEENFDKNIYVQRPERFPYPDYTFNLKSLPQHPAGESGESEEPLNESLEDVKEPYFDLSGDHSKYMVHDSDDYDEAEPEANAEPKPVLEKKSLDIAPSALKLYVAKMRYVDNVLYYTYKPVGNNYVRKVVDGSEVIWKAKSPSEKLMYAMAPVRDASPLALYLILNVDGKYRGAFFEKKSGLWVRSSLESYKALLSFLKGFSTFYNFDLDLSNKVGKGKYQVEYDIGFNPFYLFIPKLGFACRRVTYENKPIWAAATPFDRCVAVWSSECFSKAYFVVLLITYSDGTSKPVSYMNLRGEWELVSTESTDYMTKSIFSLAKNFYNPEYDFNHLEDYDFDGDLLKAPEPAFLDSHTSTDQNRSGSTDVQSDSEAQPKAEPEFSEEYVNAQYMENKVYPTVSENFQYLPILGNKYNAVPEKTAGPEPAKVASLADTLADYQPVVKPILPEKCFEFDVADRLTNVKYKTAAVFDGVLKLLSYQPPPGYYFNVVKDAGKPLFIGNYKSFVCLAVSIYLKEGKHYLADLIIRLTKNDVTVHFKWDGSRWSYVTYEEYLKLLEDLKKTSQS